MTPPTVAMLPAIAFRTALVSLVALFSARAIGGDSDIPRSGPGQAIEVFDEAMLRFLERSRSTAATLAIASGDGLLYSRGYGWLDREHARTTGPDTPMRVASVSKPITAAAIKKLIAEGRLNESAEVFPLLHIPPPDAAKLDPRWRRITVANLLRHKAGWDIKQLGYDPMFSKGRVVKELRLDHPPEPVDVIRWMMTQRLSFDPDERSAYSNFGYCILGRVIERVSGMPYLSYIRRRIFEPLGVKPKAITLAHSDPRKRNSAEPWYGKEPYVDWMDAHGGIVAASPVLCRFLQGYWINGAPRKPGEKGYVYTFFGSMPGTSAIVHQRADGINFACAFNGRSEESPLEPLHRELNRLIKELGW